MDSAQKGVEKIINLALRINDEISKAIDDESAIQFNFKKYYDEFESVMDDDFNTPQAVAVIFDFVRAANKAIDENSSISKSFLTELKSFLKKTAEGVLGVIHFSDLEKSIESDLNVEYINEMLAAREEAKKNKNYKLADEIRNKLNDLGLVIQDSKTGPTYKKK